MIEPTRYTAVGNGVVKTDPNGLLMAYGHYLEEVTRLKAEVERLSAELSNITGWGRGLESDLCRARAELMLEKAEVERLTAFTTRTIIPNEELQAQVERLTKAGDELIHGLAPGGSEYSMNENIERWNAAKEGKQP